MIWFILKLLLFSEEFKNQLITLNLENVAVVNVR